MKVSKAQMAKIVLEFEDLDFNHSCNIVTLDITELSNNDIIYLSEIVQYDVSKFEAICFFED